MKKDISFPSGVRRIRKENKTGPCRGGSGRKACITRRAGKKVIEKVSRRGQATAGRRRTAHQVTRGGEGRAFFEGAKAGHRRSVEPTETRELLRRLGKNSFKELRRQTAVVDQAALVL